MKKLIAMLLCVALVASFGVTSAFAITLTNADSAEIYAAKAAIANDKAADAAAEAAGFKAVAKLYARYALDLEKLGGAAADPAEVALLDKDYELELKAMKSLYPETAKADATAFVFDSSKDKDSFDTQISAAEAAQKAAAGEADTNSDLASLYAKLAAKEAAIAAAEAEAKRAAAEREAKIAAATKGLKTGTPADDLLYSATVAKMWAEESLAAAKKTADTAKKSIATAQKGAYTDAQAAVLNAQAYAYTQMASEINTAVADYVNGVYEAIADFYDSLG